MYGFRPDGMGALRNFGMGDTIADFFAPNDTSAPTFEQVADSVGVPAANLIDAVNQAIKLWQANPNATVGQISGKLSIGGAAALFAARNALIQIVQSANPNLNYNTIWAALAGQNPGGATMASLVALLPASSDSNIPNLTVAPVLSAASQAGELALIQAENNPTPEQQAALAAFAAATNIPLTPAQLQNQQQMTSDINTFVQNLPALPANYMSGPISQMPTAAQIAALPSGGGGIITSTPYNQMPGAIPAGASAAAGGGPASVAPTASSASNWFTEDSMISGVPNYAIAGAAAVLLLVFMKK